MQVKAWTFLIVCPLVFLAGLVDSVAGGGGVISLTAYLLAGLPPHLAYGTNKFAMSLGAATSAVRYYRAGKVRLPAALSSAAAAVVGAFLGARLALLLSEKWLGYSMLVLLPAVALFLGLNRGFGRERPERPPLPKTRELALAALVGVCVGAYDGFFGPGAGTFYMMGFVALLGYDLLCAAGNARITNFASNIGALVAFIAGGQVLYTVGVPAAVCAVAGNYVGARLALKNGTRFVRGMMVAVMGLLAIKMIVDYLL